MPALQCDQCDHCFPAPPNAGAKVRCPACRAYVRAAQPVLIKQVALSNADIAGRVVGVILTITLWGLAAWAALFLGAIAVGGILSLFSR